MVGFKTIVFIKLVVSLTIINDDPSLAIVNNNPSLTKIGNRPEGHLYLSSSSFQENIKKF